MSKGNTQGREAVLRTIESALLELNFYNLVKNRVKLQGRLTIGSLRYDLEKIDEIFVVGGGKHVTSVAAALEDILQDRISEGVVVEKKEWSRKTQRIRVVEGGHPLPDEGGVKGSEEILRIAKKANEDDLVIVCVTGGCTSLTALPPSSISLEETREVFDLLLRSGAPIEDMNAVRKHLSQVGGGKLSMIAHPARIIGLIAVDEVAGLPWGPTVPDTTTFADAVRVLKRYDLWNRIPASVKQYFLLTEASQETPKVSDFERSGVRCENIVFAENGLLCGAAERNAIQLGTKATVISTGIEGEAKDVATVLASIAREIERNARPFHAPCILIAGGETTVTLQEEAGEGGRNQELALGAGLRISGSRRIVIASIGTDGTDGPTDIAGAIVDGYSLERARKAGMDPFELLKKHESSSFFRNLQDAIYTSDTGTNLMDLVVIYVGEAKT